MNYIHLVNVNLAMGRYADAAAAVQRRREILGWGWRPEDFDAHNALLLALTGDQARAREHLSRHKANIEGEYYPYHLIAYAYAALGDKDEAFFWLGKAYQERTGLLYLLNVYPKADPLRDDPRFKDLVRRIGLEK